MKKWFLWLLALNFALTTTSCTEGGVDETPISPNKPSIPDPQGTIALSMRNENSGKTLLSNTSIYIDNANNFAGGKFVSIGQVAGLGHVDYIPTLGWSDKVSVKPGEGYIAYSNKTFYRIFVSNYILNISNEILGAEIRYQGPFGGKEPLLMHESELVLDCNGDERKIIFKNEDILDFSVNTMYGEAEIVFDTTHSFLPIGFIYRSPQNTELEDKVFDLEVQVKQGQSYKISARIKGAEPCSYVSPDKLEVSASAQSCRLELSGNLDYTNCQINSDVDWLNATISEKDEEKDCYYIDVEIAVNTTEENRSGTLSINPKSHPDHIIKVLVDQAKGGLTISPEEIYLGATSSAGILDARVFSDQEWYIESDQEWFTCEKAENKEGGYSIYYEIEDNFSDKDRIATLSVYLGKGNNDIKREIKIVQLKPAISVSYNEFTISCAAQEIISAISVSSDFEWDVSDDQEWIDAHNNNGELCISTSENTTGEERVATLTLFTTAVPSITCEVTILQEAATLAVNTYAETSIPAIAYSGYSESNFVGISVQSSSSWEVKSDQEWIIPQRKRSSGLYQVWFDVQENNTGHERTATLTFFLGAGEASDLSQQITITQLPHTFEVYTNLLEVDRLQQNHQIAVTTSNTEISATSSDNSWCTAFVSDGVTIRISENSSGQNRSATITIKLGDGQEKKVDIRQGMYAIGDTYNKNGESGLVFAVNGHHFKITTTTYANYSWSTEQVLVGASDENDGKKNMQTIKGLPDWENYYPAFAWCESKNTNGISNWFIPSSNELYEIITVLVSKNILNDEDGLENYYYISSTEAGAEYCIGCELVKHFARPTEVYKTSVKKTGVGRVFLAKNF